MGRQTAEGGRLSAWAGQELRPDARSFPVVLTYQQPCADSGAMRPVRAVIDADMVRIEQDGRARRIPLDRFRGVSLAVAQSGGDAGRAAAIIVLQHDEAALSLPLHVTHDSGDILAVWRHWADRLGCAALVDGIDGDCRIPPREDALSSVLPAAPRRAGAYGASRRPAFLRERAPGLQYVWKRHCGREIIARR